MPSKLDLLFLLKPAPNYYHWWKERLISKPEDLTYAAWRQILDTRSFIENHKLLLKSRIISHDLVLGDHKAKLIMPHVHSLEWIDSLVKVIQLHFEDKSQAILFVPQEGEGLLLAQVLCRLSMLDVTLFKRLTVVSQQPCLDPDLSITYLKSKVDKIKKNCLVLIYNHPDSRATYPDESLCKRLISQASNLIVSCEILPARIVPVTRPNQTLHFMPSITPHDLTDSEENRLRWNGSHSYAGALGFLAKDPSQYQKITAWLSDQSFKAENYFQQPLGASEMWMNMIRVFAAHGCMPITDYETIFPESMNLYCMKNVIDLLGSVFVHQFVDGSIRMAGSYAFYSQPVSPQCVVDYIMTLSAAYPTYLDDPERSPQVGGEVPYPYSRIDKARANLSCSLYLINLDLVKSFLSRFEYSDMAINLRELMSGENWASIVTHLREYFMGNPHQCMSIGMMCCFYQKVPVEAFIQDNQFCTGVFLTPTHPNTRLFLRIKLDDEKLVEILVAFIEGLSPSVMKEVLSSDDVLDRCRSMVQSGQEFEQAFDDVTDYQPREEILPQVLESDHGLASQADTTRLDEHSLLSVSKNNNDSSAEPSKSYKPK